MRSGAMLAVILAVFVGCQSKTIKEDRSGRISVSGTLTDGGQPLQVEGRDIGIGRVEIRFLELDESGELVDNDPDESTTVDADGKFSVAAGGLYPGSYRVAVSQFDPDPTDKLGGKFGNGNSPIKIEVEGDTDLEIDISKY